MSTTPDLQPVLDNTDPWWRDSAERALQDLAATGRTFDAFDLTEMGVIDPPHPNHWGALFRAAASAGTIEVAGYHKSRRPGRAGGVCAFWRGKRAA
ncbi:hypothetical protein ACFSBG_06245 [Georgenia yuyongxinii]|uniref:hypothetical protein n=1 Tax=Georgenia yuyongxinii TaxID=2589797 RepID=UPI00143DAEF0|nr:hypothetical protein [Georgenia yuyongxinii]